MNKLIKIINLGIVFLSLAACGQGFITTNPPPAPTYSFSSDFNATVIPTNCSNINHYPILCNDNSSITISVSYSSTLYGQVAYLLIPTQSDLPTGLTISQVSPGCDNQTGSNYSCQFTLTANKVESGTTVSIPYNGSYGFQGGYKIQY